MTPYEEGYQVGLRGGSWGDNPHKVPANFDDYSQTAFAQWFAGYRWGMKAYWAATTRADTPQVCETMTPYEVGYQDGLRGGTWADNPYEMIGTHDAQEYINSAFAQWFDGYHDGIEVYDKNRPSLYKPRHEPPQRQT